METLLGPAENTVLADEKADSPKVSVKLLVNVVGCLVNWEEFADDEWVDGEPQDTGERRLNGFSAPEEGSEAKGRF